ncbi:sirohydrochlorin chelatase [Ammoniphilus sp. YIM 78166]|uniref:sirohydrochlorin chelatase n=1 Tax=Ammoniphilus sp. YIM 78166 TaxID=1644106 RepID=UPI00106FD18D|nr:CbiX/SirB N-terminal domain-containing protein [Ammoniphilus sp. YIM 78166]
MDKTGILVISHGSRDQGWVEMIEHAVALAGTDYPTETAFLELVAGKSIEDGVRKLESEGINRILVVPLFLTMGSTHLHEIQYALGLLPESPIPTDLERIHPRAHMVWCSPLESHPYVLAILEERIQQISVEPSQEILLLIGHGSDVEGFHERWEKLLSNITSRLQKRFGFLHATHATFHPDNIQERAQALASHGSLIVLPFFMSEGYFTKSAIPRRLRGLQTLYEGHALLPHALVSAWIQNSVRSCDKEVDDFESLIYTLNH